MRFVHERRTKWLEAGERVPAATPRSRVNTTSTYVPPLDRLPQGGGEIAAASRTSWSSFCALLHRCPGSRVRAQAVEGEGIPWRLVACRGAPGSVTLMSPARERMARFDGLDAVRSLEWKPDVGEIEQTHPINHLLVARSSIPARRPTAAFRSDRTNSARKKISDTSSPGSLAGTTMKVL